MKLVFVDTSGFYAFLDKTDPFNAKSIELFECAEAESWQLITSNYVIHESWALIQARLGWEAVETWLQTLVSRCEVLWVDEGMHQAASSRARQARERRLSLTDCSSFEMMLQHHCRHYIGDDSHFSQQGFTRADES